MGGKENGGMNQKWEREENMPSKVVKQACFPNAVNYAIDETCLKLKQ